ncbi:hypothetical protein E2320_003099 [Naja naja]|nr:hypothetical protein E2320_003099 [Naja naja]
MELGGCRIAFEKDGVYLHTSAKRHPDQDSLIPGVIRIIEKGSDTLLQWTPVEESSDTAQIISPKDSRLYLVYTHDSDALSHSFDELQLFDDSSSNLVSEDGLTHLSDSATANMEEETGFEVITCQAQLGERPSVQRETPVTEQEWEQHLDPDGRVLDPIGLRKRIFAGGLSMSLRKEVWKYLLNYYSWGNTSEENKVQVRRKTDEYFRMKLQWKSVSEEQELRNSLLRGYRSLIERDVSRTDRNNKFYEGSENPGLVLLNDVLMTYCMYNFDLGYVQGMSDLLSPILYITQNEVDAFWCFCGFMELVLTLLLRVLDPPLCDFLDSKESGSLCFCFRWILIWFKREFPFSEILQLWEVLWTELPCPNFHLLVACGILDAERQALMNSGFGFNEILKHINELTMKMSVEDILCRAEAIYRQLVSTPLSSPNEESTTYLIKSFYYAAIFRSNRFSGSASIMNCHQKKKQEEKSGSWLYEVMSRVRQENQSFLIIKKEESQRVLNFAQRSNVELQKHVPCSYWTMVQNILLCSKPDSTAVNAALLSSLLSPTPTSTAGEQCREPYKPLRYIGLNDSDLFKQIWSCFSSGAVQLYKPVFHTTVLSKQISALRTLKKVDILNMSEGQPFGVFLPLNQHQTAAVEKQKDGKFVDQGEKNVLPMFLSPTAQSHFAVQAPWHQATFPVFFLKEADNLQTPHRCHLGVIFILGNQARWCKTSLIWNFTIMCNQSPESDIEMRQKLFVVCSNQN